jgi:hypothetical protein
MLIGKKGAQSDGLNLEMRILNFFTHLLLKDIEEM